MSKLRLLFVKEGPAAYISNLDLLRTVQRAFPRTELDIKHSTPTATTPIPSSPSSCPCPWASPATVSSWTSRSPRKPTAEALPKSSTPVCPPVSACWTAIRLPAPSATWRISGRDRHL